MKLVVLVIPREARDDAETALESVGAYGFTEVPSVYGEGATGPRFGSRIAPGVSDLIFLAVEDARIGPVREALASVERRLGRKLHAFCFPPKRSEENRCPPCRETARSPRNRPLRRNSFLCLQASVLAPIVGCGCGTP